MIKIEAFPARNGDTFLLEINGEYFLIDTGYLETYTKYIKPRLIELKENRKGIHRLIVTHIDEDHLAGAIKFLEENIDGEIIGIDQIWFNSYRNLYYDKEASELNEESSKLLKSIKHSVEGKSKEKKISAKQGSTLGYLILKGGFSWNTDFNDAAISLESGKKSLTNDISFKILSPSQEKLETLKRFWKRELYKLGFRDEIISNPLFDDAFEFLLLKEKEKYLPAKEKKISKKTPSIEELLQNKFYEDKSVTNGSSIAFVIETGQKKMLFLSDAHPSLIANEIKRNYKDKSFPVYFDLIKVSHHGSFSNNSPELLSLVDSQNFLISTDGTKHQHPDLSTLAWIISRESDFKRFMHFNYENDGSRFLNNQDWMAKYNYSINVANPESSLIISV